jgi:hypothetical protein
MIIQYERSGGFAGMRVKVNVDTNSLPPETTQSFYQALASARFFELPDKLAATTLGADQFTHHLTIDDENRHHAVEMTDSAVPDSLQPVLRKLLLMARKQDTR